MKQKINKLICRVFGHDEAIEEVFAKRLIYTKGDKVLYNIVRQTVCPRCGEILTYETLAYSITKVEMLNKGWFITE